MEEMVKLVYESGRTKNVHAGGAGRVRTSMSSQVSYSTF